MRCAARVFTAKNAAIIPVPKTQNVVTAETLGFRSINITPVAISYTESDIEAVTSLCRFPFLRTAA